MRTVLTSTFTSPLVAAATAALLGSVMAAQGRQSVPVSIQPPAAVDVVLFAAMNAGKVLTTTDANGKGSFDVADLLNLGKLDVVKDECADKVRVLLVRHGVGTPDSQDCRKRRLGAYWPGHDPDLNVRLQGGGMSSGAKTGLIAGGAGAALVAVKAAQSSSSSTTSTNTGGGNTGGGGSSGTNPMTFNGTYTGFMTATTNTCAFPPTTTTQGVLSVDSSGRGTWVQNVGSVTLNFSIQLNVTGSAAASFNAATSQTVGTQAFSVNDAVTISGGQLNSTETLNSSSCTVIWVGPASKN